MGVELARQDVFPETEDVNFSDSDLVYHVRTALKAALVGDCDSYNQLVGVMHHNKRLGPEEAAMLVTCFKALSGAVSCIDITRHGSLLDAISQMSLWNYGTDVMDALLELVISLAASSGQFVDWCLHMLVSNFVPPNSFLEILKQPRGLARKNQVLDRVHSTLKDIADLVPLSPMRVEQIVRDRIPHISAKETVLVIYVENMLRLDRGPLGELVGSTMLVAIADRLIDLDVDIPWEDILQDDFTKGIYGMELEDLDGLEVHAHHDGDEEFWIQSLFGRNETAQKLDSLLVLTFEHLDSCKENGRLPQVFEILLQSFQKTVLTACKSKFAQFVMFYACSLDPENCGMRFADVLQHIFESSPSLERRMSAVAYLASYLSRSKLLSNSLVAKMLGSLVKWCSNYCKNLDDDINPRAHKSFYAACQAIMYVLCFRMRSMLLVPRLKYQLRHMGIEEILRHPLSPLKVCLPSIVEEFLRLVKATRFFSVPETFQSSGLLEPELSKAFGGVERLDMFFPFDPCLLKKSDRFIRPNFVYWSMVIKSSYGEEEDDDDDEITSDEDVAEAHNVEEGMDIPGGGSRTFEDDESDLDEFCWLDKMSVTPKNSLRHWFGGDLHSGMQMPSRIRPSMSPESW